MDALAAAEVTKPRRFLGLRSTASWKGGGKAGGDAVSSDDKKVAKLHSLILTRNRDIAASVSVSRVLSRRSCPLRVCCALRSSFGARMVPCSEVCATRRRSCHDDEMDASLSMIRNLHLTKLSTINMCVSWYNIILLVLRMYDIRVRGKTKVSCFEWKEGKKEETFNFFFFFFTRTLCLLCDPLRIFVFANKKSTKCVRRRYLLFFFFFF